MFTLFTKAAMHTEYTNVHCEEKSGVPYRRYTYTISAHHSLAFDTTSLNFVQKKGGREEIERGELHEWFEDLRYSLPACGEMLFSFLKMVQLSSSGVCSFWNACQPLPDVAAHESSKREHKSYRIPSTRE